MRESRMLHPVRLKFGSCQMCGEPAGVITRDGLQVCGIECLKKWRSGVKTKPICPVCKGESLHRDGACWACDCGWKGYNAERVILDEGKEDKPDVHD